MEGWREGEGGGGRRGRERRERKEREGEKGEEGEGGRERRGVECLNCPLMIQLVLIHPDILDTLCTTSQ